MNYTKEQTGAKIIGTLEMAKLFGDEYIRQNAIGAAESISEKIDGEIRYFLGSRGDASGSWTEYALVGVDPANDKARFLDYKLPDGKRMEKPIVPIPYAG